MPLEKSKSDKARSKNIAIEIRAGKDPKQAEAIGYAVQRRAGGHAAHGEVAPLPEDLGHVVGLSERGLPLVSLGTGHHIEIHPRGLDQEQAAQYAEHLVKSLPHHDDLDTQLKHAAEGLAPDTEEVDKAAAEEPAPSAPTKDSGPDVILSPSAQLEVPQDEPEHDVKPGQKWGTPTDWNAPGTPENPTKPVPGRVDMYGNPDLQASEPEDFTGPTRGLAKDNPVYKEWADVEPWMQAEGARQAAEEHGKFMPVNQFAEPLEPGSPEAIAEAQKAKAHGKETASQDAQLDAFAKEMSDMDQQYKPSAPAMGTAATASPPVVAPGGTPDTAALVAAADKEARAAGIDPASFKGQIHAESGFNPDAVSKTGAVGVAQIEPSTAKAWKVNPKDAFASLHTAAQNMAVYQRKYGGNLRLAQAAYNAGEPRVDRALAAAGGDPEKAIRMLPAETQDYVNNQIPRRRAVYAKQSQAAQPTASAPQAAAESGGSGPLAAAEMLGQLGYGVRIRVRLWAQKKLSTKDCRAASLLPKRNLVGLQRSVTVLHLPSGAPTTGLTRTRNQ